ncbi:hypothetical protein CBS101457_000700 [Exobasidium rhododendri]|nr:hypothetical protein CBS101457_000700 [Exobasidium rhododendri]
MLPLKLTALFALLSIAALVGAIPTAFDGQEDTGKERADSQLRWHHGRGVWSDFSKGNNGVTGCNKVVIDGDEKLYIGVSSLYINTYKSVNCGDTIRVSTGQYQVDALVVEVASAQNQDILLSDLAMRKLNGGEKAVNPHVFDSISWVRLSPGTSSDGAHTSGEDQKEQSNDENDDDVDDE